MKILKILSLVILVILLMVFFSGLYLNFTLPNVGEAKTIYIEKSSQRIERGKYLANHVTVCMDCHSKRDWSLFSGPVVPNTIGGGGEVFDSKAGFPGEVYSTNLTPYGLKNWSDGELFRAITTGVGKDGHALFPLMAYERFGQMNKEDILSIIAYIRTLKPVKNDTPPSKLDFPVNLLNKLGPKEAKFVNLPDSTDGIRYGAYLVNAAGCVDCHSKQEKGAIVKGTEFGGGMEFRQPAGILRAPNITMHKENGLGKWTSELFIQRFKSYGQNGSEMQKIAPTELNSPMPWTMYSGMKTSDLEAIFQYLKSVPVKDNKVIGRSYEK